MKAGISFVIILVVCVNCATAQQSQTVSLQQALQVALEKNVTVVQSQNSVDAAGGRVLAAYGNYLPTLSAFGTWNRNQNDQASAITQSFGGGTFVTPASFTVTNSFSTQLSLSYLVFDGFNREAGFNSAKSNAQSAEDKLLRTRQSITYLVESGYFNVLRLGQLVKVADENLKRDRRQLDRITESNKVGATALADVYRQQSTVSSDELLEINAQNDYDNANAALVALIGLDLGPEYHFVDSSITTTIDSVEIDSTMQKYSNIGQLTQRALEVRPDYIAAKEDLSSAESGVTQARSGYYPSVTASASYGFSNNELSNLSDNKNINWGITLRWNIFDAFRTNQSLQQAIASQHSAEAAFQQSERDISTQIKLSTLGLEAARKQVEVSQKGLVSASEDYKIAQERYNLGAGTLLDLLTANAGLVNAQVSSVNAIYNYISAKRNVEFTIGTRTY